MGRPEKGGSGCGVELRTVGGVGVGSRLGRVSGQKVKQGGERDGLGCVGGLCARGGVVGWV